MSLEHPAVEAQEAREAHKWHQEAQHPSTVYVRASLIPRTTRRTDPLRFVLVQDTEHVYDNTPEGHVLACLDTNPAFRHALTDCQPECWWVSINCDGQLVYEGDPCDMIGALNAR